MSTHRRLGILVLTPSMPYATSWGFGIRVFYLVRQLAEHHNVTVVTYGVPSHARDVVALRQVGAEVRVVAPPERVGRGRRVAQLRSLASATPFHYSQLQTAAMQRELDATLSSSTIDVVQVESTQMAGFDFRGYPVVLDEHNVEYELLYRAYRTERSIGRKVFNAVEYIKVKRAEIAAWRRAQACLLTSEREETLVRRVARQSRTAVIPNGVDLDYFAPTTAQPDPDQIVFTGLLTYRPNLDAVRYFARDVLPLIVKVRPEVRLTVVGHGPRETLASIAGPNVKATGWVPDVRPYLRAAGAVVVPLRMGSGTRLKVLDALAAGKPVVTTSLGCEGIDVRNGEHVLIADEPQAFADRVIDALSDRHLSLELGRRGRELVAARYSWQAVGDRLVGFHGQLAGSLLDRNAGVEMESLPA